MGSGTRFLERYPELRSVQNSSRTWAELKDRYRLDDSVYLIQSDAQGDENDLLIDALARGASPVANDELARKFFLELPEPLQQVVQKEILFK